MQAIDVWQSTTPLSLADKVQQARTHVLYMSDGMNMAARLNEINTMTSYVRGMIHTFGFECISNFEIS